MERYLFERGELAWLSEYASLGGIVETGGGIDGTGYALGFEAVARHGAKYLPENGVKSLIEDMDRRRGLYFAGGPPKAYINVGGGVTALGWVPEAALLDNGLIRGVPKTGSAKRGLIFRMLEENVPVIHLLNIERLAARYNLPLSPRDLEVSHRPLLAQKRRGIFLALTLLGWLTLAAFLARLEAPKAAGEKR
jgi:poly-gamma-glutamate system protein